MSEHDHQAVVVQWFKRQYPQLKGCIWANLNAQMFLSRLPEKMAYRVLGFLYKIGMKKGVSDLTIAVARGGKYGLYIEMKNESTGKLSPEQQAHLDLMQQQGYEAIWCHGADIAIAAIKVYIDQPETKQKILRDEALDEMAALGQELELD